MTCQKQTGFTLIELIVVMAIMAGLMAIALPLYRSYVVKARVSEALIFMEEWKNNIIQYHLKTGNIPPDATTLFANSNHTVSGNQITLNDPELKSLTYVMDSSPDTGVLSVEINNPLDSQNQMVYLWGIITMNGLIEWHCGQLANGHCCSIDASLYPKLCAN